MKRLLILLISLAIAVVACGQEVLKRDLELRKTAPVLNLNGSGATLRFYNGDVSLTQSSNLLTLSGGNFSLGANSLLGSGSIGATGARLLKGWFTDLEITNSPTVNGVSIASIYAPLASPAFTGDLTVEHIRPATDGGASLGIYGNGWNNLFMSRGSRIYFDSDTTFGKLYFDYPGDLHLDAHLDLGDNDLFLNGGIGSDDRKVLIGKFRYLTVDSLLPYSIGTPDTVVGYGYFDNLSVNSLAISGNLGSSITPVNKGYFTELNIANAPTVGTTDTLATRAYARLYGGDVGAIGTRIDSIVGVLADTVNIEALLQVDFDTDTVATRAYARGFGGSSADTVSLSSILQINFDTDTLAARSWVRDYVALHGGTSEAPSDSVGLADVAPLLTDTKPWFVFGAGIGEAADSVAFAKGKRSFGSFNVVQDSLYVVSLDNILISANDSLKFNVYYGNRMTATPVDSLFTGPQSCGDNQTTFTPNNERTIPPGNDVWVGLMADQPTGYRPKEWNLQLNGQIRRD